VIDKIGEYDADVIQLPNLSFSSFNQKITPFSGDENLGVKVVGKNPPQPIILDSQINYAGVLPYSSSGALDFNYVTNIIDLPDDYTADLIKMNKMQPQMFVHQQDGTKLIQPQLPNMTVAVVDNQIIDNPEPQFSIKPDQLHANPTLNKTKAKPPPPSLSMLTPIGNFIPLPQLNNPLLPFDFNPLTITNDMTVTASHVEMPDVFTPDPINPHSVNGAKLPNFKFNQPKPLDEIPIGVAKADKPKIQLAECDVPKLDYSRPMALVGDIVKNTATGVNGEVPEQKPTLDGKYVIVNH
jgi:hypothetical protein